MNINLSILICDFNNKSCANQKGTLEQCKSCVWNQELQIYSLGWQCCPKCNGQGTVLRPPNVAGDAQSWMASETQFECNLCKGKMIINIETGLPPKD